MISGEIYLYRELYCGLYYWLLLTRRLEEKLRETYQTQQKSGEKLIYGNLYLSTFQEAISVGAAFAVRPTDWISHTHRDIGALLVRGRYRPEDIFANHFGRASAPSRGRDSALNFSRIEKRDILKHPFMGLNLPVDVGIAWEIKNQKRDEVVLGFLGDGATSEGFVHEAMNGAGVWKLPIVFVCNNNQWAISTPMNKQVAGGSIAKRAQGYGIPGVSVDGTDILAVYEEVLKAAARARSGGGSTFIECRTFRLSGHAEHEAADYIPGALWEEWNRPEHDPLLKYQKTLLAEGAMSEKEVRDAEHRVNGEITAAFENAKNQPFPAPESCLTGLFGEEGGQK